MSLLGPESMGVVFLLRQKTARGQGRVSSAPTDATCTVNSCIPVPATVGENDVRGDFRHS